MGTWLPVVAVSWSHFTKSACDAILGGICETREFYLVDRLLVAHRAKGGKMTHNPTSSKNLADCYFDFRG